MKRRLGFHASTAGALENAAQEVADAGGNTLQIFSASPRMWRGAVPAAANIAAMKRLRAQYDLAPLVIHANYLINLASLDEGIRHNSVHAFRAEIARALLIGAEYLVFHPGSYKNQSVEDALTAVQAGMKEAAHGLSSQGLTLLIENTAGQGAALGSKLEELAALRRGLDVGFPVGYCIDTCHSLAAGYDLCTPGFIAEVDSTLGWDLVPVIHTNDSKGARGSHLDRHAHIGLGEIGEAGFAFLLQEPKLRDKAFILETPDDEVRSHQENLEKLKALARDQPKRQQPYPSPEHRGSP